MCLTLGGGDPCQSMRPIAPISSKGSVWRTVLMICAFVHLALAIAYCFVNFMQGVFELILVVILICAISSVNFCCVTMYMVYLAINSFTFLNLIGLALQNGNLDNIFKSEFASVRIQFAIVVALQVNYLVAIVLSFCAYREFKQMLFDHAGGAGMMMASRFGQQNEQRESRGPVNYQGGAYQVGGRGSTEMASNQKSKQSGPFTGKAVTIGSSK